MRLPTTLLAGILALAGTALHAEEFQWTVTGLACPPGQSDCIAGGTGTPAPFTITFDVNTQGGVVTPTFGPNPESPGGAPIVTTFQMSFPITNYLEIVGGHITDFAAHSGGGFGCGSPLFGLTYECNGGFGAVSVTDNEIWIEIMTESQYKAFKDPLASIFLLNPDGACGGVSSLCQEITSGMALFGPWKITPVPEPGPLLLLMCGLMGLVLSRRRVRLGSLMSRT